MLIDNAWNRLVSITNVQVNVGVVSASLFQVPGRITIEGAGSFSVVANTEVDRFDVVDGSAEDCNGNSVPTNPEELRGNFLFRSRDNAEAFNNFVGGFLGADLRTETQGCVGTFFRTSCKERGDSIECTLIVPNCLQ